MRYKDKTFCASPNCTNECGRKMTQEEKEKIRELEKNEIVLIWQAYFCGEPEQASITDDYALEREKFLAQEKNNGRI